MYALQDLVFALIIAKNQLVRMKIVMHALQDLVFALIIAKNQLVRMKIVSCMLCKTWCLP